ncbi:MAG TPA: DUF4340 domain-containing protein [Anaerolineales bacterium]|nr:DUF4340 domain-containing protein [Anaerolineales bacterium]
MRRSASVIYIVLLAILAGLYYYLNNRSEPVEAEVSIPTSAPSEYLFSFEDGLPIRIKIASMDGDIVEVARDAENAWMLAQPLEAPADQGSLEAVASQVTTIRIIDHVPGLAADVVGLDNPEFTITLQFSNDVERIIEIGVLTPTENGYYVSRGDGEILIVNNSALDALIGLLTNPPYLATETPPLTLTTPEADTSQ